MNTDVQAELEQRISTGSLVVDDFFDLADIYFFKGLFSEMLEILEKAKTLQLSDLDQAHLCLIEAEGFLALGRVEEGKCNYRRSLEFLVEPESSFEYLFAVGRAHYSLAMILEDNNEVLDHAKLALEFLSNSLEYQMPANEKSKAHSGVYSWIGDMYSKVGQFKAALKMHEKAFEIAIQQEDLVGIQVDIAAVHTLQKDFRKAEKAFRKAIEAANGRVPTTKIYYELGQMYIEWQRMPEAKQAFKDSWQSLDSDLRLKNSVGYETAIIWHLGFCAYEIGDGQEAIESMTKVLEEVDTKSPFYVRSCMILAHQYYKDDDRSSAREYYSRVLSAPLADLGDIEVAKKLLASIPPDS
jgi:tetratricopeptide (TPR) repeat protein